MTRFNTSIFVCFPKNALAEFYAIERESNSLTRNSSESCLADFSIQVLFPQIFARREASHLFEEAGEMMGIIEAQEARGLADVVAVHEQALGLVDDIVVDVADGRSSCRLVDDVAEITWRISQF